tara:strand:- start:3072 stop:3632 length:561 start_codon:yes stop_codon:yes gene_type:complete
MKKQRLNKNYKDYRDNWYDDMKTYLDKSRRLMEQVVSSPEPQERMTEREEEKSEEYTVSGGKIIIHGYDISDLDLTDDEKNSYQETMDDFIEQVSDLVDYGPLQIYANDVTWQGNLIKYDVEFFFSIGETNGAYINSQMTKVDAEFIDIVEKLKSFYDLFSAKWAKVIANRKKTESQKKEEPGAIE